MANSKKLINYIGTATTVTVPTSVDNVLVREIAATTFTSDTSTVYVDAYKDEISGAPWGAQNVVWLKEPYCTISFDTNGGSGTMNSIYANTSVSFILPTCTMTPPIGKVFKKWAIGSASGIQVDAGSSYIFTENTTLFAIWGDDKPWDTNPMTAAEATAFGYTWVVL